MSFRIFAAGSDHFHYETSNNYDGSEFDAALVISKLMTASPDAVGALGAGVDIYGPSVSIVDAANALARIEMIHLLNTTVSSIAMRPTDGGSLFVSCRTTHALWPDTLAAGNYTFSPGDSPGYEFFRTIKPALVETDLDTWGVLLALVRVMAKFDEKLGDSTTPRLLVQITH